MIEHRRAGGFMVRAANAVKGLVTMRAVTYGVVDSYASLWAPGVFDESLNRQMPIVQFDHNSAMPIGRGQSWKPTAEGPEVTARLDNSPDVPLARQVIAQIASGTLTDCSVGFEDTTRRDPTDEERAKYPGVREVITRSTLSELSIVSIGAVPGAGVTSMRSRRGPVRNERAALKTAFELGRMTRAAYELELEVLDALDLAKNPTYERDYSRLHRLHSVPRPRPVKASEPDKPAQAFDPLDTIKRMYF